MTGKQLFEQLTDIDDELILNADKTRRISMNKIFVMVASLALVVGIGSTTLQNNKANYDFLPQITLSGVQSDGMGFEAYSAYDISELFSANPWNEKSSLSVLPVFENTLQFNDFYRVEGTNYTIMETMLKETGELLGMDVENLPITNDIPSEETQQEIIERLNGEVPDGYFDLTFMYLKDDKFEVSISTQYTTEIYFVTPFSLPSEYIFTYNSSYENLEEVSEYFLTTFDNIINFEEPVVNISSYGYDFLGRQIYNLSFYEKGKTETESILNYNFNTIDFNCDDDGNLFLIRINYVDLSNHISDYPVITIDEATQLLFNGNYITNVPDPVDIDKIKKVELIYKNNISEKTFLPYYRFYVEIQNFRHEEVDTNDYGAYYVPAISGEFIENMPQ